MELGNVQQQINGFQQDESAILKQRLDEFIEKASNLKNQKAELHQNEEKIHQMMNQIIERKTETFFNMLNLLNRHFAQIFKKFFPNGQSALVLKMEGDLFEQNTENDIDKIDGIEIRTSLEGAEHIQSSLIALSLILAIQKCLPSPLYLIDSIDEVIFELQCYYYGVIEMINNLIFFSAQIFGRNDRNILAGILKVLQQAPQIILTIKHPELTSIGHAFFHLDKTVIKTVAKSVAEVKVRKQKSTA